MNKENKRNLPAIIYEPKFNLNIKEIGFINESNWKSFDWLAIFRTLFHTSIIRAHQGELKQEE